MLSINIVNGLRDREESVNLNVSRPKVGTKLGTKALTDTRIAALKKIAVVTGKDVKVSDPTTRGLALLSRYNGKQSWTFRWTLNGKDKLVVLGHYPRMSLAKAREEAAKAHLSVESGEDARQTKQAQQQPFSTFLDAFYARWKTGKRDGTIESCEPKVELLKKRLGDVPVSLITTGKIADALSGLPATTANRCLYITQQALRIAVVQNAVKANVARELKRTDIPSAPKGRVPRTVVSVEGLRVVIAKVADRSQVSADVLRIVALCATRIQETVLMEWQQIDWTNRLWNIPAEARKGKLDVRHGLVVPLSQTALSVLTEIQGRRLSDRWVFVGNRGGNVDRRTVLANLKLVAPATVHGFRKLFSTQANEHGFDANVIEAALGHVIKGVAGVYNQATYLDQRRTVMEWWAGWLEEQADKESASAQVAV